MKFITIIPYTDVVDQLNTQNQVFKSLYHLPFCPGGGLVHHSDKKMFIVFYVSKCCLTFTNARFNTFSMIVQLSRTLTTEVLLS